MIVGIDPGLTGGIAFVNESGTWESVYDLPILGAEIDTRVLLDIMNSGLMGAPKRTIIIEKQGAMPRQGVASTFKTGMNYGKILAIADTLDAVVRIVPSQRWKREFNLIGKDKDYSRLEAIKLFPSLSDSLKRKMDHGRAEALLLAEWGRRQK